MPAPRPPVQRRPARLSHLLERDLTALAAGQPGSSTLSRPLAGSPDSARSALNAFNTLNHRVQCLDFTAGCVTTLARMRLVQSTGFLYDCYAYGDPADPAFGRVVRQYRDAFSAALARTPPAVLVLSNQNCGAPDSFAKLARWPALAELVATRCRLLKEVTPPEPIHWAGQPAQPYSYRLYLRR